MRESLIEGMPTHGLYDVGKTGEKKEGDFVQIVRLSQLHYVTISNIQFDVKRPKNTLNIYDPCTKLCYQNDSKTMKYPKELFLKVSELTYTSADSDHVFETQKVVQSPKEKESYIYAILFAYCLCKRIDPLLMKLHSNKKLEVDILCFLHSGSLTANISFDRHIKHKNRVYYSWCEKNKGSVRSILDCPDEILEKMFFHAYVNNSVELHTLKQVCRRWYFCLERKYLLEKLKPHRYAHELQRVINVNRSKPEFSELYHNILNACEWLIRNEEKLISKPTLPFILSASNEFLRSAYSFLILNEPDTNFGNYDEHDFELWENSCRETFQNSLCFVFDNLNDMHLVVHETRSEGINIDAHGPDLYPDSDQINHP